MIQCCQVDSVVHELTSQGLATILWAFATLGVRPSTLLLEVTPVIYMHI